MSILLPDDHPLYHPLQLRIVTPAIEQLLETLTQWLWTGATGGFIEGEPRCGKTTALIVLLSKLYIRNGKKVPCHHFSAPPRDRGTIQSLYRNLCISANLPLYKVSRGNADIYLEDFFHFLMDKAISCQSDQVVLFVDEMQRLKIEQIEAFAELHDLMAKHQVLLTVFFTGNDTECDKLISNIEAHSRRHVQARFFSQRTTFEGIKSRSELKKCLSQYDEMKFPDASGPTYTEACLPSEVKNGFKLSSLAPEIWAVYRDVQKAYGLKSWGMKYFTSAVMTLLFDYLPNEGVAAFCPEMFECCIEVSGLLPNNVRRTS